MVEEVQLASSIERPRRLVTLQRDGAEFVVSFYPEDMVVFRQTQPNAPSEVNGRWPFIPRALKAQEKS